MKSFNTKNIQRNIYIQIIKLQIYEENIYLHMHFQMNHQMNQHINMRRSTDTHITFTIKKVCIICNLYIRFVFFQTLFANQSKAFQHLLISTFCNNIYVPKTVIFIHLFAHCYVMQYGQCLCTLVYFKRTHLFYHSKCLFTVK